MIYGYKLLAADGRSITSKHGRVFYPINQWVTVPGNGAYVAVSDGLTSGGLGPLLAVLQCEEPTGAPAPNGVACYRRVRRVTHAGQVMVWCGSIDVCGCDLRGVTLPARVGGSLDVRGCDLRGATLPAEIGGSLDVRGCDLTGVALPAAVGGTLYVRGCGLAIDIGSLQAVRAAIPRAEGREAAR